MRKMFHFLSIPVFCSNVIYMTNRNAEKIELCHLSRRVSISPLKCALSQSHTSPVLCGVSLGRVRPCGRPPPPQSHPPPLSRETPETEEGAGTVTNRRSSRHKNCSPGGKGRRGNKRCSLKTISHICLKPTLLLCRVDPLSMTKSHHFSPVKKLAQDTDVNGQNFFGDDDGNALFSLTATTPSFASRSSFNRASISHRCRRRRRRRRCHRRRHRRRRRLCLKVFETTGK